MADKAGLRPPPQLSHGRRPLVARQIVHHDDVAWLEFGNEDFCDMDLESVPVDGTVEDEGRRDAADPKTGDEGRCLPSPWGMLARSRSPRAQRPCVRAMFVEVQVSSMKTRRSGSSSGWLSNQSSRRFRADLARLHVGSFFARQIVTLAEAPKRGDAHNGVRLR